MPSTDKELAEKIAALGVGMSVGEWYCAPDDYHRQTATGFVEDWRVAGALMEKMSDVNRHCFLNEAQFKTSNN